jgi:hypothetical protein
MRQAPPGFPVVCFLLADKARLALSAAKRKQKYQNGNTCTKFSIHRKLLNLVRVTTSEREGKLSNPRARAARAPCMEKIYVNLWKPARARRARYAFILPQPRTQYPDTVTACVHTHACTYCTKFRRSRLYALSRAAWCRGAVTPVDSCCTCAAAHLLQKNLP